MKHADEEDDAVLGSLPSELQPPAGAEDRIAATLRREGLLGRAPRRYGWLAAAAVLAAVLAGVVVGRYTAAPTATVTDQRAQYLLLLYEDPGFETRPDEEMARVSEYSAWAGGLAQAGSLVGAEKLSGAEVTFVRGTTARGAASSSAPGGLLGGFFLVRAANAGEAEQIARQCPHLRHGGRVVVRPIEPTRQEG